MSDSNEQVNDVTELKEHYVYVLIDPRNNKVFYVGKGTANRVMAHGNQVDAFINHPDYTEDDDILSNKQTKIKEIKMRPQEEAKKMEFIIGRYHTTEEALAVESTLIKWVYGFDNLTNIVHGHGHDSIRAKDDFSELPCIDVPKPTRSNDGSFTEGNINGIIASGLDVYLTKMKDLIKAYHEDWNISDIALENMNVSFYITVLDIAKIECYLPAKAKYGSPIQIRVRSMTGRPSINFTQLATRLNCTINNPKGNPYFRLAEDNINDDLITRLSIYDKTLRL